VIFPFVSIIEVLIGSPPSVASRDFIKLMRWLSRHDPWLLLHFRQVKVWERPPSLDGTTCSRVSSAMFATEYSSRHNGQAAVVSDLAQCFP
jgi:hypothetical protein